MYPNTMAVKMMKRNGDCGDEGQSLIKTACRLDAPSRMMDTHN